MVTKLVNLGKVRQSPALARACAVRSLTTLCCLETTSRENTQRYTLLPSANPGLMDTSRTHVGLIRGDHVKGFGRESLLSPSAFLGTDPPDS